MRRFSKRLFLVECWYRNKLLFFASLAFIALELYGHKTGCEITPALDYDMYSRKIHATHDSALVIKTGDHLLDLFHTVDEPRRMMIYSTLSGFYDGVRTNRKDPMADQTAILLKKHPYMRTLAGNILNEITDYDRYPGWLVRYMQHAVDRSVDTAKILFLHLHYDAANLPIVDSIKPMYEFTATP